MTDPRIVVLRSLIANASLDWTEAMLAKLDAVDPLRQVAGDAVEAAQSSEAIAGAQLAVIDTTTGDRVGTLYRGDLPAEARVARLEHCLRVVMEQLSVPSLDADGRIGKALGELSGA